MKKLYLLLIIFVSCTKQDIQPVIESEEIIMKSTNNNGRKPIVDDFGHTLKQTHRKATITLLNASANAGKGKGWGKGGKPKGDDENPPPPTRATNVILLDFNGHTITNPSSWWLPYFNGVSAYSGLTETAINTVGEFFSSIFAGNDVLITTDEAVHDSYDPLRRVRIVFTETAFFPAGGVAFLNSRSYGTDEPAYVFTNMLSYSGKFSAEAGVHEASHTLGLHHQADFIGGIYQNEYSKGFTRDEAPVMGNSYDDQNGGSFVRFPLINGTWTIWSRICDCHVNEVAFLSDPLKLGVR